MRGPGRRLAHGTLTADSPLNPTEPDVNTRKTGVRAALITVGLVLALGLGAFAARSLAPAAEAPEPPTPPTARAEITSGPMTAETTTRGKLRPVVQRDVVATSGGVITELPAADALLVPGTVAHRIDTKPVVVMAGSMPAWRDFAVGMTPGPDVRQLEENLRTFGYLDAEPSEDFTWHTKWAVRSWQRDLGLPAQDSLSKDLIMFAAEPLRVGAFEHQVGERVDAGAKVYRASGAAMEVAATIRPADAELAPVGTAVTVEFPGGTSAEGTVTSVGAAEEQKPEAGAEAGGTGEVLIPIVVTFADQSAAAGLSLVSVSLRFSTVVRDDVLTVPVDALIPIEDDEFAVELPAATGTAGAHGGSRASHTTDGSGSSKRQLIPVEVGAFASGLVEISGEGIRAGLEVTVPER